jgi:hypothetical protein
MFASSLRDRVCEGLRSWLSDSAKLALLLLLPNGVDDSKLSLKAKLALLLPMGVAPADSKLSLRVKLALLLLLPNGVDDSKLSASPGEPPFRLREDAGRTISDLPTMLMVNG